MLAPYGDNDWQIWACSAGNANQLPRVNIWFEMHMIGEMMAPENRAMAEPFFAWLKTQSDAGMFDVVMCEFNKFVPKAIPYPLEEMIEAFGRNWLTSSVAYMLALAIARGATEIALFGVDMAADQEHYSAQRAGCVYFIELAERQGIQVHVPFESCLKQATPLYGYWEGTPMGRRINASLQQAQGAYNQAVAELNAAQARVQYFSGGLEQLRYFARTFTDGRELDLNLGDLPERRRQAMEEAAKPSPVEPLPAATGLGLQDGDAFVPLSTAEIYDGFVPFSMPQVAITMPPKANGHDPQGLAK